MIRTSLFLFAVFLGACEKSAPPPPPAPVRVAPMAKPAPKTATWKWSSSGSNLTFAGEGLKYDAAFNLSVADASLHIGALSLPVGSKLTIDGSTFEVTSSVSSFDFPLDARFGELPWEALKNRNDHKGRPSLPPEGDLKLPVRVELAGFAPIDTTLPKVLLSPGLHRTFLAFTTGEKHWPGEQPGPAPAAAAWTLNDHFDALGTAPLVRDVRLIVVGEMKLNGRTKKCSGYPGVRPFVATSYDLELKIIDRHTREAVARKNFVGQAACPPFVAATNGEAAHSEGPSYAAMKPWVLSQLGPLSKKLK